VARAHAQTASTPADAAFGMTPHKVSLVTYWTLHGVLLFILVTLVFHMLFAKAPLSWAKETATFLLGFLVHTAVPFPT
jgi:hypothetical protein